MFRKEVFPPPDGPLTMMNSPLQTVNIRHQSSSLLYGLELVVVGKCDVVYSVHFLLSADQAVNLTKSARWTYLGSTFGDADAFNYIGLVREVLGLQGVYVVSLIDYGIAV